MQLWLWTLRASADRHRRRWRQALSKSAPGRDLPPGRRALLAAGGAAVHSRRGRTGEARPAENPVLAEGLHRHLTSSPTSATCSPRAPPAKSAASAPSWSLATTGIRPGTKKAARAAIRQRRTGLARRLDSRHRSWPAPSDVVGERRLASAQSRALRFLQRDWNRSSASAPSSMAASPARSWPKTAPPKH